MHKVIKPKQAIKILALFQPLAVEFTNNAYKLTQPPTEVSKIKNKINKPEIKTLLSFNNSPALL